MARLLFAAKGLAVSLACLLLVQCADGFRHEGQSWSPDFHAALGVAKNASEAEIREAFLKIIVEYPEQALEDPGGASERFEAAREAYVALTTMQGAAGQLSPVGSGQLLDLNDTDSPDRNAQLAASFDEILDRIVFKRGRCCATYDMGQIWVEWIEYRHLPRNFWRKKRCPKKPMTWHHVADEECRFEAALKQFRKSQQRKIRAVRQPRPSTY
eukprot:gb/GFBE01025886.1/.p1 GENE.gb/GFBE01025886.1/~~gb/GFBE01025886.1/.p1  ORF type:complete len:213 (+),score=31.39 gb/GFBE01025886.1/:1-639(+)